MSKNVSRVSVSLDTFLGCYIYLPREAILHALLAVDDGILDDYYLGSYLTHLDRYFWYLGDINSDEEGRGLVPEDSQDFFERKLFAWLRFWSIDENSWMGKNKEAIEQNKRVLAEMAKD